MRTPVSEMNPVAMHTVCDEIIDIMRERDDQEARGIWGTPGGLEHMGDVWSLLARWRDVLLADNT